MVRCDLFAIFEKYDIDQSTVGSDYYCEFRLCGGALRFLCFCADQIAHGTREIAGIQPNVSVRQKYIPNGLLNLKQKLLFFNFLNYFWNYA